MKKKQEQKNVSFHIVMILDNGIQKIKDQNLWNIFNGKHFQGEHFRAFPISNWTEMDVWNYIKRENIAIPSLYFAHERRSVVEERNLDTKF